MQTMTISEFMSGDYKNETITVKVTRHYDKYKVVYRIGAVTLAVLVIGTADFSSIAEAADISNIDAKANEVYKKLVKVGKWIIIGKGGVDTIKSISNGDAEGAKKYAFSYLMIFLLLLAMPWAYEMIEDLFEEL